MQWRKKATDSVVNTIKGDFVAHNQLREEQLLELVAAHIRSVLEGHQVFEPVDLRFPHLAHTPAIWWLMHQGATLAHFQQVGPVEVDVKSKVDGQMVPSDLPLAEQFPAKSLFLHV